MDYLATQADSTTLDERISSAKTSDEILNLILARLNEIRPELAVSFKDFILRNDQESNTNTTRIWINGAHPLQRLNDEQSIRNLRACLGDQKEAEVFQAVIRQRSKRGIVYNRDAEQLTHLEQTGAPQASFTYVHEWLRDFTDDANIIMHVNAFIHSKEFFRLSAEQIERVFQRHGLDALPGSDRIVQPLVPPLSVVRVAWDGVLYFQDSPGSTAEVAAYLCHQATNWKESWTAPDLSSCVAIRKLTPIHLGEDERPWTQQLFGGLNSVVTKQEIILAPGNDVNDYAVSSRETYITLVASCTFPNGGTKYASVSVDVSELKGASVQKTLRQEQYRSRYSGGSFTRMLLELKFDLVPLQAN